MQKGAIENKIRQISRLDGLTFPGNALKPPAPGPRGAGGFNIGGIATGFCMFECRFE